MVDDDSISVEGRSLVGSSRGPDGTSFDSGCTIVLGADSIGATVVALSGDMAMTGSCVIEVGADVDSSGARDISACSGAIVAGWLVEIS